MVSILFFNEFGPKLVPFRQAGLSVQIVRCPGFVFVCGILLSLFTSCAAV